MFEGAEMSKRINDLLYYVLYISWYSTYCTLTYSGLCRCPVLSSDSWNVTSHKQRARICDTGYIVKPQDSRTSKIHQSILFLIHTYASRTIVSSLTSLQQKLAYVQADFCSKCFMWGYFSHKSSYNSL